MLQNYFQKHSAVAMMNFLLSSFDPGDSPCMSWPLEAGNLLLPLKYSAGPLSVYCCDGSLGFLLLFFWPVSSSLDHSDSASPILKSIQHHSEPQHLSNSEPRWRPPKFWALPVAPGGNCWDADSYCNLLGQGRAAIPSSLENDGVKPWRHWGPQESHIHDKSVA